MNFEVAMEMQRIATGEKRTLTRGQIAEQVIDLESEIKHFNDTKKENCRKFYAELIKDPAEKEYDIDSLMEESEKLKEEFLNFSGSAANDEYSAMYDAISDFFLAPPFEGLDMVEYGVCEVCVFSALEYFAVGRDNEEHENCRQEYSDSIARRTYDSVAEHWMKVYDDLQNRYDKIGGDDLYERMTGCAILAIAAIRDQDPFSLDMAEAGAEKKGAEIYQLFTSDEYKEGESAFTDNAIKLTMFMKEFLENR